MVDDQYRGLLTDREREILAGEADVSDNYRYRVVSRVRTKIENIEQDVAILAESREDLLTELREAVCSDAGSVDIAAGDSSDTQTGDGHTGGSAPERERELEPAPEPESEPEPESHPLREAAETAVDQNWKGSWEGRREDAVRDLLGLFDWLADQDGAKQKGDFLEQYPEFAGPYPSEEFPQAGTKKGGWWRHYVSECLEDIPGVERFGQNGRRWSVSDDRA